jgi:LacI family transcriptional regulator
MSTEETENRRRSGTGRVTLAEIGESLGLSRATVSLVLRGSPLVADSTRERVLEAMRQMGYVYHRAAASLRTQRSQTVGLIVSDITNPFFAEMTVGIEARLDAAGYVSLLGHTAESREKQERLLATMREFPADGILLCPADATPASAIEGLLAARVPLVLFARYLPGVATDYVGADNVAGATLAVEHLIALGHRRIAFIGGPPETSARRDRERGYRQTLERHDLPIDEALVLTTATTREGGYNGTRALLRAPRRPTALLCFNDAVAFGAMFGVQSIGLLPGRDVAVVGFDDVDEAALSRPTLTTVAVTPRKIGEEAAGLLLERIEHPESPPRQIVLPPQLMVRESCGGRRG